jgi:uncharacterized protein with HEPN domain
MPLRDWKMRIKDILDAIGTVQGYTKGMKYEAFVADRKTVDAVIRNFIVIGEAATHVPEEVVVARPEIPWRDMRDMRNFVVHEYFGISDKIIWDTVQNELPPLIDLLKPLLELQVPDEKT